MAKKRKKMLWWILGGVGAVVVLMIVVSSMFGENRNPTVEVDKVKVEDELVAVVTASGEIKPKQYVNLQAEIPGVITDLYVQEGDRVDAGKILLKIDPVQTEADTRAARFQKEGAEQEMANTVKQIEESKLNVRISEATLRSSQADLEQAKANLTREEVSFRRKKQLHGENLISSDEFDMANANFQVAQSRVTAAEARIQELKTRIEVSVLSIQQMQNSFKSSESRVQQYRAMLDRAEDMLSKTVIYSPLTGVITKLNVEKGERAVPGNLNNPSATLMTIADLSIIEAEVKVDETDIINVKLGQKAKVKVDAIPDKALDGHVTEIGNSAITAGQAVGGTEQAKDFKVVVQLDDPPNIMRPGLSATADITTSVKKRVTAIPLQALVIREVKLDDKGQVIHPDPKAPKTDDSKGKDGKKKPEEKQGVFVVDASGKAVFTPVTTGIMGAAKIEVTAGLKEGDDIAVGSFKTLRNLKDGDMVNRKKPTVGTQTKDGKEE